MLPRPNLYTSTVAGAVLSVVREHIYFGSKVPPLLYGTRPLVNCVVYIYIYIYMCARMFMNLCLVCAYRSVAFACVMHACMSTDSWSDSIVALLKQRERERERERARARARAFPPLRVLPGLPLAGVASPGPPMPHSLDPSLEQFLRQGSLGPC